MNRSKLQRLARPPVVEFNFVNVAIVAGGGMLVGFVVEIVTQRLTVIFMFTGAMIGLVIGGLFESLRFWWRRHGQRKDQK